MLSNALIVLATIAFMELFSIVAHKYVMHGWGWFLHRSHHEAQLGAVETNDIYLLILALAIGFYTCCRTHLFCGRSGIYRASIRILFASIFARS